MVGRGGGEKARKQERKKEKEKVFGYTNTKKYYVILSIKSSKYIGLLGGSVG